MLTRPYVFQHPYKASPPFSPFHGRPAGFRIPHRMKPCLNLFQGVNFNTARSPQSSPLSSPLRDGGVRHSDNDAPPTQRLPKYFTPDPSRQPRVPPSTPKIFSQPKSNAPPSSFVPSAHASPRKKHGHKQLTMNSEAIRPFAGICGGVGPRRRRASSLSKDKVRQRILERHERLYAQARKNLSHMRHEVAVTMRERDMTDEDRVFVEQLEDLHVDSVYRNDLSRYREKIARAEEETKQRMHAHEERDREAALLWEEAKEERARVEREAQERQKRRQEEQQRYQEQEARRAEQESRRAQEERRLAREARERAEREQQLREQQERELREERERNLREARERFLQEERERFATEEQQRQAREREEMRRAAAAEASRRTPLTKDGDVVHQFNIYEAKWAELKSNHQLPPIDASELPWPFLTDTQFSTPEQITCEAVQAFIFHPQHPSAAIKSRRERVKVEVLRFHPDKFNTRVLTMVKVEQRAIAQEVAGAVARILTKIMAGLDKET